MIVFRISTPGRADDLSGTGAKLYGGRWNSPGNPVIYTAESISLAMLEKLVHSSRESLMREYALARIFIPDDFSISHIAAQELEDDWQRFPFPPSTVAKGDEWLQQAAAAVLKVPSAVNSFEYNYLVNPLHAAARQVRIEAVEKLKFDLRLQ